VEVVVQILLVRLTIQKIFTPQERSRAIEVAIPPDRSSQWLNEKNFYSGKSKKTRLKFKTVIVKS
jgi:hypothetical protein